MSASTLLSSLRERGVVLSAAGSKLTFDAPTGELTAADRAALREHKAELLALLTPTRATEAPLEEPVPAAPVARPRKTTVPRRRGPKEQFSHDPLPIMGCPACSGRRWRLRSTPQTGGAWLWVCAACADAAQATGGAPL